jgi:predicted RNase H-like HicB family nuclease
MTDMLEQEERGMTKTGATLQTMPNLDLTIVYEDGEDGFVVSSIPAVPGVLSQGRTRDEARENVLDALALMLSPEPVEAGDERERELLHLTVS